MPSRDSGKHVSLRQPARRQKCILRYTFAGCRAADDAPRTRPRAVVPRGPRRQRPSLAEPCPAPASARVAACRATARDVLEALRQVKYPGSPATSSPSASFATSRSAGSGRPSRSRRRPTRRISSSRSAPRSNVTSRTCGHRPRDAIAEPALPQRGRRAVELGHAGPRGPQGIPRSAQHRRGRQRQGRGRQVDGRRQPRARARASTDAVGLLDADVYGPSVPLMLGLEDAEAARHRRSGASCRSRRTACAPSPWASSSSATAPVIWRGPMVTKLICEFLRNVDWGELDFLVLDLPPGTGDVQLTLAQQLAMTGGVIVTTPQDVALADVKRGVAMFQQVNVPVLGVIENMSGHVCRQCGHETDIFGRGGGERMAQELGIPFLGAIAARRRRSATSATAARRSSPPSPIIRSRSASARSPSTRSRRDRGRSQTHDRKKAPCTTGAFVIPSAQRAPSASGRASRSFTRLRRVSEADRVPLCASRSSATARAARSMPDRSCARGTATRSDRPARRDRSCR